MPSLDVVADRFPYWATTLLLVIGLYGMIGKRNLLKKAIGVSIFQAGIVLFYVAGAFKTGASVPIVEHGTHPAAAGVINPLPHVLMLTAIVVSVATSGVAVAFAVRIYREFRSLDEQEVLARLRARGTAD